MVTTNSTKNSVFEELAIIQASFDEFPNPGDHSRSFRCRSLISDRSRRCLKDGCLKAERQKVEELFSELQNMTECPEADEVYQKMELFITYTHCSRHLKVVLEAFLEWKKGRTTATTMPSTFSPASPSQSASSSSDNLYSTSLSETSDAMSQISISDGPIYAEPHSDSESEGVSEIHAEGANEDISSVSTAILNVVDEIGVNNGDQRKGYKIPGLGEIVSPKRTQSLRNHAAVFQAINNHPTEHMVKEGTVYILEHLNIPGIFKIGFSKIGAEERLRQPGNCFRTKSKIIYETGKRFCGAQQAEKIIQASLIQYRIMIRACEKCGRSHREWFKAPREKIFDAVTNIETFVQMPAYVEENGEWKLSVEAYKIVKSMCYFEPLSLAKNALTDQKGCREVGPYQEVVQEVALSEASQEADIRGGSEAIVQIRDPRISGYGEETDEGQFTALPLRPKTMPRVSLETFQEETVEQKSRLDLKN